MDDVPLFLRDQVQFPDDDRMFNLLRSTRLQRKHRLSFQQKQPWETKQNRM